MVFHTHSERLLAAMGENPSVWLQITERQSEKSKDYPFVCLVCNARCYACWSMTGTPEHGWSGLARGDLAQHEELAVPINPMFLDQATGEEVLAGEARKHHKEGKNLGCTPC